MHICAAIGHEVMVQMLLKQGENPVAWDAFGRTPLHLALQHGQDRIVDLFLSQPTWSCSRTSYAKRLLHAEDIHRQIPLHIAAAKGNDPVIKLLLKQRTPTSPDVMGRYPLHYAVEHGHETTVRLLLGLDGADSQDSQGTTPLMLAAQHGQRLVFKLLAERAVELSSVDSSGKTALVHAAERGHVEIVKMLLELFKSRTWGNTKHHDIHTALLFASANRHEPVVNLLLVEDVKALCEGPHGEFCLCFTALNEYRDSPFNREQL